MQTGPAGYDEAINAGERHPSQSIEVEWDEGVASDITDEVGSWTVDRSLTTDQPQGSRMVSGYTSASLKLQIDSGDDAEGDPTKTAAWKYSPLNVNSPLYNKPRLGAPIAIQAGLDTPDGQMHLPQFTGRLRTSSSNVGDKSVEIESLDDWENLRNPVTIPAVINESTLFDRSQPGVAFIGSGLNSQFLIDEVLRQAGYHTCQPTTQYTIMQANLHGSVAPNIGTMDYAATLLDPYGHYPMKFSTDGPHGLMSLEHPSKFDEFYAPNDVRVPIEEDPNFRIEEHGTSSISYGLATTSAWASTGYRYITEFWVKEPRTDGVYGRMNFGLSANRLLGEGDPLLLVQWGGVFFPPDDKLYFMMYRDSELVTGSSDYQFLSGTTAEGGRPAPGTGWHFLSVEWIYTASGVTVLPYIDGVALPIRSEPDGVLTNNGSGPGVTTGTLGKFREASLVTNGNIQVEGVQVHVLGVASVWDHAGRYAHQSQATVDPGLLTLTYSPVIDGKIAAEVIQDITKAEQGTFEFTETGRPIFRNRNRFRTNATPTKVFSSLDSLVNAEMEEAIDSIRNVVTAKAKTVNLNPWPYIAWKSGEVIQLPPRRDTIVEVELDRPTAGIRNKYGIGASPYVNDPEKGGEWIENAPLAYSVTTTPDGKGYYFYQNPSGRPQWLDADVEVLGPSKLRIVFHNKTGLYYYTNRPDRDINNWASGNGDAGSVSLYITAKQVAETIEVPIEVEDPVSVDVYGRQGQEIEASDWHQSVRDVKFLAADLLTNLRRPQVVISDLDVVPDYRIQLGDLIQVEADEVGLNDEFWVIGNTLEGGTSGHSQKLAIRTATHRTGWILGRTGRSELGTTANLV